MRRRIKTAIDLSHFIAIQPAITQLKGCPLDIHTLFNQSLTKSTQSTTHPINQINHSQPPQNLYKKITHYLFDN
jgi:hypothetical protein